MSNEDRPCPLPLVEAIVAWCDADRVAAVREAEMAFDHESLIAIGVPPLSVPERRSRPTGAAARLRLGRPPNSPESPKMRLTKAWTALLYDFRQRVERGEIHLAGAPVEPEPRAVLEAIPKAWVFDYDISPLRGTVSGAGRRWLSVQASTTAFPEELAGPVAAMPSVRQAITAENVGELPDNEVLLLLEEHAKRAICGPHAKFSTPGKISLMPFVAGKMHCRAKHGELLETLTAEAEWLTIWVKSKVTLHQVPSALTIAKVLGGTYRELKARSKAAIQNSNG